MDSPPICILIACSISPMPNVWVMSGSTLMRPEQQHRRAEARGLEGTACGRRVPHTFNHHIRAAFARSLPHTGGQVLPERVDSQIRSNGQPGAAAQFHRLTENDLRRAGKAGQLHHQQADGSPADHTYCTAGPYTCGIDTVQAARQRLGHGSCLKGQLRCQFEALCRRRCAVLCKPAVPGDAKRLQMLTELLFTVPAGRAGAAVNVGVYGDMIARRQTFHIRAYFFYNTRIFVSQNHRRRHFGRARLAVVNVDICTAHAARHHANAHFVRGQRPLFHIPDFKFPVAQKESSLHRRSILSACSHAQNFFNSV